MPNTKQLTLRALFALLRRCAFMLAVAAVMTVLPPPAQGQTLPTGARAVDKAATGSNNGTTWADAFEDLETAIDAAFNNSAIHELWVKADTYTPTFEPTSGTRFRTFRLKSGLAIYGGFAGGETLKNQRDPVANVTILSGDLSNNDTANFGNRSDNAYHVVTANRVGASAILDGFTIKGGFANNEDPVENGQLAEAGGGIIIFATDTKVQGNPPDEISQPVILRCIFEDNFATNGGAAYVIAGGTSNPKFGNCVFRNNKATNGAGLYHDGTAPGTNTGFFNSLFHDNLATGEGSAIYGQQYPIQSLLNCTVTQNTSQGAGGAIVHLGSSSCISISEGGVTVHASIIWNNTASGSQSVDWQIDAPDSRAIVTYSDVEDFTNGTCGDSNNIDSDPLFVNAGANDFRIANCASPCVNAVDEDDAVLDTWDVAQDGTGDATHNWTPDLAMGLRVIGETADSKLDMGCYEMPRVESCLGDVAPSPCLDGTVDINDYTAVVLTWNSPCEPAENCAGDTNADGNVDIDDYSNVVLYWGDCPGSFAGQGGGMTPEDALAYFLEHELMPPEMIAALIEAGYIN